MTYRFPLGFTQNYYCTSLFLFLCMYLYTLKTLPYVALHTICKQLNAHTNICTFKSLTYLKLGQLYVQ